MRFHVVIPSRYAATRLPGKPLRLIAGEPMIAHVVRRGVESGAATVCVATDDQRIVDAVRSRGGQAWLTSDAHTSGTDRIFEVALERELGDDEIVVNLQGDEPAMDPSALSRVADLLADKSASMATLATPITTGADLLSPNVVKVIVDDDGHARWFSRAPIPWVRDQFTAGMTELDVLPEGVTFLRHLGIYAYRVGTLRKLCAAPPHPHETAESLEQLRALAMGIGIRVAVLDDANWHGVDTEADLARAEAVLTT